MVPGRGPVLCASAIYAFRISDGASQRPADWYTAVSAHGGTDVIPDSMSPLPGAELLVLGAAAPVAGESREAFLRCGSIERHLVLRPDPDNPEAPLVTGPQSAVWHRDDNPGGRGGPEDERPPLIVDAQNPDRPLWLGPTPFDHPMRLRHVGTPSVESGTGWPDDADSAALHDAHEAFRTEALHPGDRLAFGGLAGEPRETRLPAYRITITSGRDDARCIAESTRIHCVALIPEADIGAMIWRTAIDLGDDDILGESVITLIAALEDAGSPVREPEHWGYIAAQRWLEPATALDDRPLLPAALAAAVTLPFQLPEGGDVIADRHAAAESWMHDEIGVPENPFVEKAPEEVNLVDKVNEAGSGDEIPDANAIEDMAAAALAVGKRRHEAAGFKEPDAAAQREPRARGRRLEAEIERRLSAPYQAPQERAIAEQLGVHAAGKQDAADVLGKLAEARTANHSPPLHWPALDEDEAERFGDRLAERLAEGDLERHADVSCAVVSDDSDKRRFAGRRLDGLLAEETVWRGVTFAACTATGASFVAARFESCEFRDCSFERVNFSRATFSGCSFEDCSFHELHIVEPVWMECRFERCVLDNVTLNEVALREVAFQDGSWRQVQLVEGLMVEVGLHGTRMEQVTFTNIHAPHTRFVRVGMFKVWAMATGFLGSVFEDVEARTCGFVAVCHFGESRFTRVSFAETGFSGALFAGAVFAPGCLFTTCDLTGAVFADNEISGVRFVQCALTASQWSNVRANDAWFFGALVRGVDFADTELGRAVFMDADIEGARFQPDKTIGADFRGTVGRKA